MARRPKKNFVKKFGVVAGVLVILQLIFIGFYRGNVAKPYKEVLREAIMQRTDLAPENKAHVMIQLAVTHYMQEHGGKPPKTLDALVPTYFDAVPKNPVSKKPFDYSVEGSKFKLGDPSGEASTVEKKSGSSGDKDSKGISDPAVLDEAQQSALIASLNEPDKNATFIYDPTGKRDPFRPFSLAPRNDIDENASPLERYTVGQLKLTAILDGFDEPKALVENAEGRGFTVGKGTKIGPDGEIIEILRDRLVILETTIDFTGEKKTRTVEMTLRTKDQDEAKRPKGGSRSAPNPGNLMPPQH